jgi:hypothetical protein
VRQPLRRRRRDAAKDAVDERGPDPTALAGEPTVMRTWDRLPGRTSATTPLVIETDGLAVGTEPIPNPAPMPEPLVVGAARASGSLEGDGAEPPDVDKQAAYAAWAERMRGHKKAKLAGLDPDPSDAESRRGPSSPYWDASTLFASVDGDQPTDPALMATRDLLAVLELDEGAGASDLQAAYRRLAKEHHPDRWYDSTPEVRSAHETRMALITEAHRELKRRGL